MNIMAVLYVLLAILIAIILILMISVRITFTYGDKISLKVGALFYNYDILSEKKKKKTKKPKTAKKISTPKESKSKKKSGIFSEFTDGLEIMDFISIFTRFITRLSKLFRKRLRVRLKKFRITVGGDSPDKTAVLFGAVSAGATLLIEYLENNTALYAPEKSDIKVNCDFSQKETVAEAEIYVRIRIIHLLGYVIGAFFDFIKIKESKSDILMKGTEKNERK